MFAPTNVETELKQNSNVVSLKMKINALNRFFSKQNKTKPNIRFLFYQITKKQ
jgi:hypothetical protein